MARFLWYWNLLVSNQNVWIFKGLPPFFHYQWPCIVRGNHGQPAPSTTSSSVFHSTRLFNRDDPIFTNLFPWLQRCTHRLFSEREDTAATWAMASLLILIALFSKLLLLLQICLGSPRRDATGLAPQWRFWSFTTIESRPVAVVVPSSWWFAIPSASLLTNLAPIFFKMTSTTFGDGHPIICGQGWTKWFFKNYCALFRAQRNFTVSHKTSTPRTIAERASDENLISLPFLLPLLLYSTPVGCSNDACRFPSHLHFNSCMAFNQNVVSCFCYWQSSPPGSHTSHQWQPLLFLSPCSQSWGQKLQQSVLFFT